MTPRHRLEPVRTGGAVRRAVVTSVLSAVVLTSVTITTAGFTLTSSPEQPEEPAASAPPTTATSTADPTFAPPVDVEEAPVGIPDVALVSVDGPSLDAIPDQALAAYQRAAAVLEKADKKCHLEWTLVAAVGQVVSGHGSIAGSELNGNGVMRPAYVGKPLRGAKGKKLPDSDVGRLDGDNRFDRPVGPMQLAPSSWSVVGVDADGDDKRNPHDIDDASLAVSVLLCSGTEDLRKRRDRVAALKRINDDRDFIETVLAVDRGYRAQASEAGADAVVVANTSAGLPSDLPSDLPTVPSPSTDGSSPSSSPTTPTPTTDVVTWPGSPLPTGSTPTGPTTPTDSDSPTGGCPSSTPSDTPTASPSPPVVCSVAPSEPTDETTPTLTQE